MGYSTKSETIWLASIAACLAVTLAPAAASTAEDDVIVIANAPTDAPEEQDFIANLDQWVFQGAADAAAGTKRMETQVSLHLAEIERTCQLTEAQKTRLQLAARGDVRRFLEEVERLRTKFNAVKQDQNLVQQMWQEAQPLQVKQARGVTGPGSLLMKVVSATLTPEQVSEYEAILDQRRRFRYRASVAVALHTLESSAALKHEQRKALAKLLLELPPPRVSGPYDYYLVTYRLASLPASKVQPLFDDRQWQALTQQFNQFRGMRTHLIEQGYIAREDLAEPVPEAR